MRKPVGLSNLIIKGTRDYIAFLFGLDQGIHFSEEKHYTYLKLADFFCIAQVTHTLSEKGLLSSMEPRDSIEAKSLQHQLQARKGIPISAMYSNEKYK